MTSPQFFAAPEEFRAWLESHHSTADELWVGFYKKGSGEPSMTWPESVDEALCYGWIDAVRKSIDAEQYAIRFTSGHGPTSRLRRPTTGGSRRIMPPARSGKTPVTGDWPP